MVTRQVYATLLVAVALGACTPKPAHTIPVALLVEGDAGTIATTAVAGLELSPIHIAPSSAPAAIGDADAVARARGAYLKGNFDACRVELAKLDLTTVLAARDRGLAARKLLVDAACAWGAANHGDAQDIAKRFASFGLDIPDQLAVSPDVEIVFSQAVAAAGTAARTPLQITGEIGGRVSLDGRDATCTLPCTIDVVPGEHVIAVDTDGFQPAVRLVRAPSATAIALAQQPADAELAAQQWRARVGRGLPAADVVGAHLIARLAAAQRVAYVHADTRLSGALVVDGKLVASATRDRGETSELLRDLAYDAGVLQRPALWQRPLFWIVVGSAAIVVGGAIAAVTYRRPIMTSVGF